MICGEQAEYGGYLELGFGPAKPHYPGALALNTARNCLAYVLRARNIRMPHSNPNPSTSNRNERQRNFCFSRTP